MKHLRHGPGYRSKIQGAVLAIGFTSKNTEEFRPAIIQKAREVFFPNLQNILGGVKILVNTL